MFFFVAFYHLSVLCFPSLFFNLPWFFKPTPFSTPPSLLTLLRLTCHDTCITGLRRLLLLFLGASPRLPPLVFTCFWLCSPPSRHRRASSYRISAKPTITGLNSACQPRSSSLRTHQEHQVGVLAVSGYSLPYQFTIPPLACVPPSGCRAPATFYSRRTAPTPLLASPAARDLSLVDTYIHQLTPTALPT